ncbi:hypothetical protein EZV62_019715 [Acer yangbiense]|uniref:Uncharacterized protein n=1 Tax=Acer yangbiense TaxID=1000413 RepID=A0A5C7HC58_9ROSI|nr:hypothetical protein EZV62_019715 [Acer yangbiense]
MVVLWIQRRVYMNHSFIFPSVSSTFLKFQVHSPNSDCLMIRFLKDSDEYQNLYKKQLRKAPETTLVWTLISEPFELVCCCSGSEWRQSLMPHGKQLMGGPNWNSKFRLIGIEVCAYLKIRFASPFLKLTASSTH